MKKITIYIFLVLIFQAVLVNAQSEISVTIGTDTLSSNYPFTTYWDDGRTDILYTANEILAAGGAAGYINTISFYVNHVDTITMSGFNVKFMNTSDTALSGFGNNWFTALSSSLQILAPGWQTIYLAQPFGWNGSDNIVIEICYNNSRWTWFSTVRSTNNAGKTYGKFDDLPSGDGCVDFTTGSLQTRRPNIMMTITPLTGIIKNPNVPDKYSLSQNYPNPFNPVTKINYTIPKAGYVSLKIYDLLGRQVADLVNETKRAGSYTIDFNAAGVSSGVYYYKMISGDFSDIKKMTVIK